MPSPCAGSTAERGKWQGRWQSRWHHRFFVQGAGLLSALGPQRLHAAKGPLNRNVRVVPSPARGVSSLGTRPGFPVFGHCVRGALHGVLCCDRQRRPGSFGRIMKAKSKGLDGVALRRPTARLGGAEATLQRRTERGYPARRTQRGRYNHGTAYDRERCKAIWTTLPASQPSYGCGCLPGAYRPVVGAHGERRL
jgi:hypothetical protein